MSNHNVSWVRKLLTRWGFIRRATPRRRGNERRRLHLETLECRVLPATITGTTALSYTAASGINNNLSVIISGSNFVFNDTAETITTSIVGATGSGTNTVDVPTASVTSVILNLGDGADTIASAGVVLATQTLTINHTGTGLSINGPLTTTATTGATGAIAVSNTGTGDVTVAGAITTSNGNVSISSTNNLLLNANLNAGTGTITFAADTSGTGTGSFTQNGTAATSTITTTGTGASAVSITVNTASGGTGNASIRAIADSGTLTVNSNGGNILYAGSDTMTAAQQGIANSGSAPVGTVVAKAYKFTATESGSIGTSSRPIETTVPATNGVTLAAGSGGAFLVDWGNPLTLSGATATGAGNVTVVTANASGHNLTVAGAVSTGSGSIFLAADDNFTLNAGVTIGGASFSGTVTLGANRDNGNTSNLDLSGTILTANTTSAAVTLDSYSTSSQGAAGGIILGNITVGNGGTITATTLPIANSTGLITANTGTSLNAGATGTVVLTAPAQVASTAGLVAIGSATTPINVTAGTVIATATASTATNGSIFITTTGAATFTALIGGPAGDSGNINLTTTTGALTIGGTTSAVNSGTITLTGAAGVVVNATLGSAATGALAINGALSGGGNIITGTGNITVTQTIGSTYSGVISGAQGLTTVGAGSLTLTSTATYSGGTTVNAGTLQINGLPNTSSITTASGTTLLGTGTVGPLTVGGQVSPATLGTTSVLNTGNLSFGSGATFVADVTAATAPGTTYDQLNVTGTVTLGNAALTLNVINAPTIGDSYILINNDGTDPVVGTFNGLAEGANFTSGAIQYKITYVGGDGNDVVVTALTGNAPPPTIDVSASGVLSYIAASGISNNLTVSTTGSNYVFNDTAQLITLGPGALAAGWTGNGTNTATGPLSGVSSINVQTGFANDTVTLGPITTASAVAVTVDTGGDANDLINIGGTVVDAGGSFTFQHVNAITQTASTLLNVGTGSVTMTANDIGISSADILTQASTINATGGAGGVFVTEADGATITATSTSSGDVNVTNLTGTLTLAAAIAGGSGNVIVTNSSGDMNVTGTIATGPGNVTISNTGGSVTVSGSVSVSTAGNGVITLTNTTTGALTLSGPVSAGAGGVNITNFNGALNVNSSVTSSGSGNVSITNQAGALTVGAVVKTVSGGVSLSSGDDVIVNANIGDNNTVGSITIAANTDGAGSQSYTQSATATLNSIGAGGTVSIMVNTTSGGTGNAILGVATVGASGVGSYTVNANGGSVLMNPGFTVPLRSAASNTNVLSSQSFSFTTTGAGSLGTATSPLQISGNSSSSLLSAAAGNGGLFYTDWLNVLTVNSATATGSGNILIQTSNSGGHNLEINGNVTTGSGSIALYADDDVGITPNGSIGGTGFNGTVDLQANLDLGNGQVFEMKPGSPGITTSNATANAVDIQVFSANGSTGTSLILPAGGAVLGNITTGSGGTINVVAGAGTATARSGSIAQLPGTTLNVGTGTVALSALTSDSSTVTGNIGTAASPITIQAGTIVATTTGSAAATATGTIYITSTGSANFTANTTGATGTATGTGVIVLTSTTGIPTIAGATADDLSPLTLNSFGGVIVDAPLGDPNSGAIAINAGTANVLYSMPMLPGSTVPGTLAVTGNLQFGTGSSMVVDLNGLTAGTQYDQVVLTGTVDLTNATLTVNSGFTPAVGTMFMLINNDSTDAVAGTFANLPEGTIFTSGAVSYQISYVGGDGNDVVLTVVPTPTLDIATGGLLTYTAATGIANNLTVSVSGNNYTFSDTAQVITLGANAVTAGWMGNGTNTVTGLVSSVTAINIFTLDQNDTVTLAGATNPVSISGGGDGGDTLNITGNVTESSGNLSFTGFNAITQSAGTLLNVGSGSITLTANSIGTSSANILTQAGTIIATAGVGGAFVTEADGANFTATATGAGNVSLTNLVGTLNIAGLTKTVSGNISLSSGDDITINANVGDSSTTGTIAIAANTDGAGTQGYTQATTASLRTSNATANAVGITVNTVGGGTGNAVLGIANVGTAAGGTFSVNVNSGSIATNPGFAVPLRSAPSDTNVVTAFQFDLNSTGTFSSVGSFASPIMLAGSSESSALSTTAGNGGIYVLAWTSNDLNVTQAVASGSGNIQIQTSNAGTHDLNINGPVTTGSGNLALYSDDDLIINGTGSVGGIGFSGTVDLQGNLDLGNGQVVEMKPGSSIFTMNTSLNAVSIQDFSAAGAVGPSTILPAGGVVLSNVTTGPGGTLTVIAGAGNVANRLGSIAQLAGTSLNVGPTGVIVLSALSGDATTVTGNIGTAALPIAVTAGTVLATTSGNTAAGITGSINITAQNTVNITATTIGAGGATAGTGAVQLTTTTGMLTIGGATNSDGGPSATVGTISLNGATGVVINSLLGDANSGNITINGGTGNIVFNTPLAVGANLVSLTAPATPLLPTSISLNGGTIISSNGVQVGNGDLLSGTGTVPAITVSSGGTVSPGIAGPGTLNTGNVAFAGGNLNVDLNGTTAGAQYDQLNVTGTVALGNAALNVTLGFVPTVGNSFEIISNDAADSVNGTFAGLAQGTTFSVGSVTFQISYSGGDGNDVVLTEVGVGINQAPTISAPTTQTTAENTVLTFSSANGNAVSVADPDASGTNVQVTLTSTGGTAAVSTTNLSVAGNGTASVTATGTLANLNAALIGLTFTPTSNLNGIGAATLQITANDRGNIGTGGAQTASTTIAINLSAVNQAPVVTVPGVETTASSTPVVLSAITVADVDAGTSPLQITLTATNGTLTLNGTTNLTFTAGTGTGNAAMTFSGALTDVNTALNGLTFTPTTGYNGSATIQITANDQGNTGSGGVQSATSTAYLSVGNPPIVLSEIFFGIPGPDQYIEFHSITGGAVVIPAGTYLVGIDGNQTGNPGGVRDIFDLSGMTTGTNGYLLLLQNGNTYPTALIAPGTNVLTNIGTGAGWGSGSGSSTVSHTGASGATDIAGGSASFLLIQSATPPTLSDDIDSNNTGTPGGSIFAGWTVLDSAGGTANASTSGDFAYGAINFIDSAGAGAAPSGTAVSLAAAAPTYFGRVGASTGSATSAWVGASTAGAAPVFTLATVAGGTGAVSGQALDSFGAANFTSSAPIITSTSSALTYTEAASTELLLDPGVTDADSSALLGGSVSITTNFAAGQDVLVLGNTSLGISGSYNATTGVLTLTGVASPSNYQTAMRSVLYYNTGEDPNSAAKTVTFAATDGVTNSMATRSINFIATNDPPIYILPGTQTSLEDTSLTFSAANGNQIQVGDPDAKLGSLQMTLTVTGGMTTIGTSGLTVNGNGSALVTATGTLAALNSGLNGLVFTPLANINGTAAGVLQFSTNDQGNTGTGGPQTTTGTVAINVIPVNDPPTLSVIPNPAAIVQNSGSQTINLTGISAGPANESSQTVSLMAVSSNPSLIPNPTITYSNPSISGSLSYTPIPGATGTAVITVTVTDNGGTANGGVNFFTTTFTVTVNPNQAPTASDDPNYTTGKNVALTVPITSGVLANDTDPDNGPSTLTAVLVTNTNPTSGLVTLNPDGSFTFTPASGFTGTATFTYQDNDGLANSNIATATITISNQPPVATVSLNTFSPQTNDTLTATATRSDPNGDTVTLTYVWMVNGNVVKTTANSSSLTDTLDLSQTGNGDKGQTVTVQVTPNDGTVNGTLVSASATVIDSVPTATVALNTAAPKTNDTLTATATTADADGDAVTLTYVWMVNNVVVKTTANSTNLTDTLDLSQAGNGDKGQVVSVAVTPNDGTVNGKTVSASGTVLNSAPTATVRLNTSSPATNDTLTATATNADADGDAVSLTYVWLVNGNVVKTTTNSTNLTDTLDLSQVGNGDRGQVVSVEVTPNDGTVNGTQVAASATVVDTPPTATVVLNNSSPATNDTLTATATKADIDGDAVALTYVWKVNGVVVKTTANSTNLTDTIDLSQAGNGDKGQVVSVAVTPNDGTVNGTTVSASAIVVNSVPTATVALNTASPKTNDTLTATATKSDADGDTVTLTYVWKLNGVVVKTTANSTNLTDTLDLSQPGNGDKGQTVSVEVTPNDGTVNGTTVSASATVLDSAPVAGNDSYSTIENNALIVAAPGLLGNDSDADHDALTIQQLSSPLNGNVTINPDGSFTYTPNTGFVGNDAFTYKVNDGSTDSNVATVLISANSASVGVVDHFLVTASSSTITAGAGFGLTVTAQDSSNQTVTSYTGTVQFTSNDPLVPVPTSSITFANGIGIGFTVGTLEKATTTGWTITAKDANGITGSTSTIDVIPAAATHFSVSAPGSAVTGSAFNVTVTALDAFGNTATGYAGIVHFISTDPNAILPAPYTFTTGTGGDDGSHTFTATFNTPGNQTITVTDFSSTSFSNSILTHGLFVTSFATTPTGFTATFSKVVNITQFDYYRFSASQAVPPDVAMATVGSTTTNVNGTLLVTSTATQTTITFVATQGILTNAAKYFVTLTSGANGIVDSSGEQLAGDANGFSPGTSYVATGLVPASAITPTLSIPGFARGPNSSVNVQVPNSGTGIPITLTHAPSSTTEVQFTLDFNPASLDVTGPTSGTFTLLNPGTANSTGVANFEYNGPALSTTSATLGNIVANVPNSAANAMLQKALLDLPVADIFFNGSATPASPVQNADGVQVMDYLGETTNNFGVINSNDAANAQAVVTANATPTTANQPAGFKAFPLADPFLITGSTNSSTFKVVAADVTGLSRFAVNLSHPFIPTPPTGLTYSSPGPDPTLSIPTNLVAIPGGTVVVPVNIDDPRPAGSDGMTEAELALTYDPSVFSVTTADVQLGTVPAAGSGWTLTADINPLTGQIAIALDSLTPISSAELGGSLVIIDFHVKPGASAGTTPIKLVAAVNPTGQNEVWTRIFDTQQEYTLSPEPTKGPGGIEGEVSIKTPVKSMDTLLRVPARPTMESGTQAPALLGDVTQMVTPHVRPLVVGGNVVKHPAFVRTTGNKDQEDSAD